MGQAPSWRKAKNVAPPYLQNHGLCKVSILWITCSFHRYCQSKSMESNFTQPNHKLLFYHFSCKMMCRFRDKVGCEVVILLTCGGIIVIFFNFPAFLPFTYWEYLKIRKFKNSKHPFPFSFWKAGTAAVPRVTIKIYFLQAGQVGTKFKQCQQQNYNKTTPKTQQQKQQQ